MAQEFLDGPQIGPVSQKVGCEGMAKRVRCYMRGKIKLQPQ